MKITKESPDGTRIARGESKQYLYDVRIFENDIEIAKVDFDSFEFSVYGITWAKNGTSLIIEGRDTSGDPCRHPIGFECFESSGWKGIPIYDTLPPGDSVKYK